MNNSVSRAVSPVVGVILVIAITVALSGAVGVFVFDLGQSVDTSGQQSLGVHTTGNSTHVTVKIVTGGADELKLLVDGTETVSKLDVSPGDALTVGATADETVSIVSVTDGTRQVISTNAGGTRTPISHLGPVDNFESGTVDAYTDNADGTWSAQSTVVKEGTFAGKLYSTGGTTLVATSTDGLDRYPERGDTFSFWVRGKSGTGDPRTSVYWAYTDNDGYYRVRLDFVNNEVILQSHDGGSNYPIHDTTTPTLSTGVWYQVEIEFKSSITATVYDESGTQLSQLTATDSTRDTGGIQFTQEVLGSGDSTGYVDDYRITESD